MSSPISINDQSRLEPLFKKLALPLSEYSFANCYLFRKVHSYEVVGDFLKGVTRDGFPYYLPLTFPIELAASDHFYPIPEAWLPHFSSDKFQVESKKEDDDYLFHRQKIQFYPGRRLAGQRNLAYQFEAQYDPLILPFEAEGALEVLQAWAAAQESPTDYAECKEAIEKQALLKLEGLLFAAGKEPLGFLLAEKQLPNAYVIHFAKTKPHIKGITPYMYRAFATSLSPEVSWINLEQDLGLPGLEKSKSSYLPDHCLKKYRLYR